MRCNTPLLSWEGESHSSCLFPCCCCCHLLQTELQNTTARAGREGKSPSSPVPLYPTATPSANSVLYLSQLRSKRSFCYFWPPGTFKQDTLGRGSSPFLHQVYKCSTSLGWYLGSRSVNVLSQLCFCKGCKMPTAVVPISNPERAVSAHSLIRARQYCQSSTEALCEKFLRQNTLL